MKYMLDTNICIYAIKKKPEKVLEHLACIPTDEIGISAITYSELMHGVFKSKNVSRNYVALAMLLANITILDFDQKASECYGKIRADLEYSGQIIGPMDMLIAAHAMSLNLTLVTNNTREFTRVNGLAVENWVD